MDQPTPMYPAFFDWAELGVAVLQPDGQMLYCNPVARQLLGLGQGPLPAIPFPDLLDQAGQARVRPVLTSPNLGRSKRPSLVVRTLPRVGDTVPAPETVGPDPAPVRLDRDPAAPGEPAGRPPHDRVRDSAGMLRLTFSWVLDRASRLRRVLVFLEEAEELSGADGLGRLLHDPLTGLPTRTLFNERLNQAMQRIRRDPGDGFCLGFLDLNGFKQVNDTFGHPAGDAVLTKLASRMQSCLRAVDYLARVGGDEFALLLEGRNSRQDVMGVVHRVLESIAKPVSYLEHDIVLSASIGLVLEPQRFSTSESLMAAADQAMYRSKTSGGDRISVINGDSEPSNPNPDRDLRKALRNEQLRLYLQPIVELSSGRIVAMEALVRWQHPVAGLLTPAAFLESAAHQGLLSWVDAWMVEQAAAWLTSNGNGELAVHCNLSPHALLRREFLKAMERVLDVSACEPGSLCIELREDTIRADNRHLRNQLNSLRSMGCRLVVDNFGARAMPLSRDLFELMDCLKLDAGLIAKCGNGASRYIRGLLGFAREMCKDVIAEGIEVGGQRDRMIELGCSRGQGYFFCVPLPAAQATGLLHTVTAL